MATLRVEVVSPAAKVYEGEATSVVAPAWDGKVGILPRHAPMIALLGAGELDIDLPGGGSRTFHVAGGTLKVEDDVVTVLSEYAGEVPPESLDDFDLVDIDEVEEDGIASTPGNPLA